MLPSEKEAIKLLILMPYPIPRKGAERRHRSLVRRLEVVLTARKVDKEPVESYRPFTTAGQYVPTMLPIS